MVDNTKEKDDFEFEVEQEGAPQTQAGKPNKPEIEVEDDTPPEDRGRAPMPKALVEELEAKLLQHAVLEQAVVPLAEEVADLNTRLGVLKTNYAADKRVSSGLPVCNRSARIVVAVLIVVVAAPSPVRK